MHCLVRKSSASVGNVSYSTASNEFEARRGVTFQERCQDRVRVCTKRWSELNHLSTEGETMECKQLVQVYGKTGVCLLVHAEDWARITEVVCKGEGILCEHVGISCQENQVHSYKSDELGIGAGAVSGL